MLLENFDFMNLSDFQKYDHGKKIARMFKLLLVVGGTGKVHEPRLMSVDDLKAEKNRGQHNFLLKETYFGIYSWIDI
jgi:hypothetical protein